MKRFNNILYFADGKSDRCPALDRAVKLAKSNGGRLTLFDVIPDRVASPDIEARINLDLGEELRRNRSRELDELVARLDDSTLTVDTRVASGVAFVEVIRAVIRDQHDLVIKEAKSADSFVRRTLGSTDLHLLRKCPCPTWIDQPDAPIPYKTVLAAVDPSADEDLDRARMIMEMATSLSGREGADLAIVHAWGLPGESLLRTKQASISGADLDSVIDDIRVQHTQRLGDLLGDFGIGTADNRVHLVKGDPAPSIRTLSNELHADLVIMGTLGRRTIPGLFIGTTAEDVLTTTQASVLAIKPASFVSPVTTE
jgi:nucleotide-binding universal stress UspA family protein